MIISTSTNGSNAIDAKNSDEVNAILQELVAHTIAHFSGEEEMMREKMFPPYSVHKGEHDRALNELKQVSKQFNENRDLSFAKSYVKTLDTVTAMFLTQGISPCSSRAC